MVEYLVGTIFALAICSVGSSMMYAGYNIVTCHDDVPFIIRLLFMMPIILLGTGLFLCPIFIIINEAFF